MKFEPRARTGAHGSVQRVNMLEDVSTRRKGQDVTEEVFCNFTLFLMEMTNANPTFSRMDSTLINSYIRYMSRNELIYVVAQKVVCLMNNHSIPMPSQSQWYLFLQPGNMKKVNGVQATAYQGLLSSQPNITKKGEKRTATLLEVSLAVEEHASHHEKLKSTEAYKL